VLNNHIDMSILLNLGYTCPDSTQEEIRVLREARELQRSICFRTLLESMAQDAIDQNCDIEPLFESFANVTYDTEGSVSGEETSDDWEVGTGRLQRILSSYNLSQVAAVLCHVVREMTAAQYSIPVIGYIVPAEGRPFHWDNYGHFRKLAFEKAFLLIESTGQDYLVDVLGIDPVLLVEEVMRENSA